MARITRKAVRMASKKHGDVAAGEPAEVSPKVAIPAIVLAVLGVVLIIVSAIPNLVDHDVQNTLLTVGLSLIGASGVGGIVGFQAPPGRVVVDE